MRVFTVLEANGARALTDAETIARLRGEALSHYERYWLGRRRGQPSDRERHWAAEHVRLDRELRALVGRDEAYALGEWVNEHWNEIRELHREEAEPLMRPTPTTATPDAEPGTATAGTTATVGHAAEGRPDVRAARAACSEVRDWSQRHGTARGRGEPPSQGLRPAPIEIG